MTTRKSITIELFPFAELSKDVQDKIVQRELADDCSYASGLFEEEHDFIDEEFSETLEKQGFENAFLMYTGFCNQGDGASFTADVNNDVFFTENVKQDILKQCKGLTYNLLQKVIDNTDFTIKRNEYSHYYHENTMEAFFENHYGSDGWENVDDWANIISKYILEKARKQARKYYKQLEKAYYTCFDEYYIQGYLTEDDTLYTESGISYADLYL